MKHFIIITALIFILPAQQKADIVYVEIAQSDLEYLGGWPLDRKWYAIAIDRLQEAGASEIYIDISFPNADAFHPESDQLFQQKLRSDAVFLLSDARIENDSVAMFGNFRFPATRTFRALNNLIVENGSLRIDSCQSTILGKWAADIPESFSVRFNGNVIKPDYYMTDLLRSNDLNLSGKRVLIGLNAAGYSSYIAGPDQEKLLTATELSLFIYEKLRSRAYFYRPTLIQYLVQMFLLISFFMLYLKKHKFTILIAALSVVFNLILYFNSFLLDWYMWATPLITIVLVLMKRPKARLVVSDDPELKAELQRLRKKLAYLETNPAKADRLINYVKLAEESIVCHPNSPIVDLYEKAGIVAQSSIPVMIYGESGTGKEGLANFIHKQSGRKNKPFIAINCGGLTESLIESEIFGHEAGAFTGANKQKLGKFELANQGTLFLDEIAETSEAFQVKLLRVLQEGRFERVGGNQS
ncbi:MAG: sigma 54-interacting transcriptional regulator, partial [Calditrichaeota bacterium]|nr:sigma 54-interacting transcriptional regulator [Calditrichota bacterium]